MSPLSTEKFDALVIGSGMGGLAAASFLAQFGGQRVLVLERHFKAGGFTHTFQRKKWHWDVGLHYVGEMHEKASLRQIFDLATGGEVKWQKMPDPLEYFVYPEHRFALPADPDAYRSALQAAFPQEQKAIDTYFKDLQRLIGFFQQYMGCLALPTPVGKALRWLSHKERAFALQTTGQYLASRFRDPQLRGVIASQWGDYGLPPGQSALLIHALIAHHYLRGGYYPIGGSGTLAASIEKQIKAQGGEIRVCQEVSEILIEGSKAVGVRVRDLRSHDQPEYTLKAPRIVSDAGVWNTYLRLMPPETTSYASGIREFFSQTPAVSALTLYLGFESSPRDLGYQGENYWLYPSYDHDRNFASRHQWLHLEQAQPPMAYLSFPSLKDPLAQAHTGEIITVSEASDFKNWEKSAWKKRGKDYETLKAELSERLLNYVEGYCPGLKAKVAFSELSTPLSNAWFTAHPQGMIYGAAAIPERFKTELTPWHQPRTPIPGLYLTGADAGTLGIGGALAGGLLAATAILGPSKMAPVLKQMR
ncbi:NAD(P)/FAD-dependent oxidoreductase [bacterium (Candidatus Blackallbacteria) CG17_big_fil_post_rev_8_21_14_2_50_48_46]|uniref:NAD(P)/FAD-dependent oxidoreductase n=1 Tax=bacterium (Candidatus Blackallbacteria) CG17_big_fil_post_rev_8_21_14_2_50_48_46 TaxID=2014261 RepID=A0A2M7G7L1_9BACT|nr:MAG: phytoene dehydrogenase [bacterium (Candidatus Blackallbacteria) CG18_big_fil_WC_8_21_14_2_50_49_26]PIW17719.1 MAG: NAD(P)/FAD-dependent oxidoreductase [bacterium (Candidatus Blackallbacteria) CG17_big_fil_post_rev_8_21_14_2_50_48_46]PIW47535.1 MAG: NAD(P)/FAD-dependent oxidoreductase [bacterium (Candidatus Blackallbacteria) CG13_big_fil_rev_8_21_14_2_50_49_14]